MSTTSQDGTTYESGYGRRPSATDTEGFDRGTGTGEPTESVAHKLRLMKRADDGYNARDWDDFLGTMQSEDVVVHQIGAPTTRGRDAHRKDMEMWIGAFPDMRVHNDPYDIQFGQGDWTVAMGRLSGTFTGQLNLPDGTVVEPTGKAFETFFTTIGHWKNEQLDIQYVLYDAQDIMAQIGVSR